MVELVDVVTRRIIGVASQPTPGYVTPIELVDRGAWFEAVGNQRLSMFTSSLYGVLWIAGLGRITPSAAVFRADEAMLDWLRMRHGDYQASAKDGIVTPWFDFVEWLSHDLQETPCIFGVLLQDGAIST